ncbi:hypothetical protein HDU84_001953 [Entophlyctis sp. JEL0112]|nr:hypothetical protein HDU84_001953 [Entophlyctis sp. JEL0112]
MWHAQAGRSIGHAVNIVVDGAEHISSPEINVLDIKKLGRSASVVDRGITELFDNSLRRDVIDSFLLSFKTGCRESVSRSKTSPQFVDAAYALAKWSVARFHRLLEQLKEPAFAHVPEGYLLYHIESLQFALESIENAEAKSEERYGENTPDREVWSRYAVAVEGQSGLCPDFDPISEESNEFAVDFDSFRKNARRHFQSLVFDDFAKLRGRDFYDALYLLPKFKHGHIILETISSLILSKVPDHLIEVDVIPRIAALNILQTEVNTSALMLELSAHTQKSECARIIIDSLADKITSEGIITAFIPASVRGADHFLALLELYCMDRAMQASLDTEINAEQSEQPGSEDSQTFMKLVASSCYIFIFLAAAGGRAQPSTVAELIEFYKDPCVEYMPSDITPKLHRNFVAQTFHSVCSLNLSSIAWALVEKGWVPKDINASLLEAVELGHQNIVHLLLESLLKPDEKLEPSCIPLVYRKSEALNLLPVVAKRFPREAAWFLEQLSCIPLPACVPRGPNEEPDMRTKPVHGVRLGTLSLLDAVFYRRKLGTGSVHLWPRLAMDGVLKQAGSGKDDLETECLVCTAPEALLTSDAVHQSLFDIPWTAPTSAFIRLLAEDDPQITLQPIMRALMEFHWSRGNFWLRFAVLFSVWSIYVPSLATVCIQVVMQQNSDSEQYTKLSFVDPLSYLVAILSLFFIFQELREFHDYPIKYIHSPSNIVDASIHVTILYVVIAGLHMNQYIQPILMSLVVIFCALRIISHLRVLPSVGPLVRLWVTASVNILPILIPYGVMALGFTIAFYIIEYQASREANTVPTHFYSIADSVQSVLTMAMTDYSVLDNAVNPYVFLLRFLFYICFIIFLVNIIIALMTVNVADIHSNMNAAWLLEIAGIMVDLEMYWPFPQRYSITASHPPEELRLDLPARPRRSKKVSDFLLQDDFYDDDEDCGEHGSQAFNDFLARKCVILYTWPKEYVVKTAWWPLVICRALENAQADEDNRIQNPRMSRSSHKQMDNTARSSLIQAPPFESVARESMWRKFGKVLGLWGHNAATENATTAPFEAPQLLAPDTKAADDSKPNARRSSVVEEIRKLPPVTRRVSILKTIETRIDEPEITVEAQRTSLQKDGPQTNHSESLLTPNIAKFSTTNQPTALSTIRVPSVWTNVAVNAVASSDGGTELKKSDISLQLDMIVDRIKNMEQLALEEAKATRDRMVQLEDAVERERHMSRDMHEMQKEEIQKLCARLGEMLESLSLTRGEGK